MNKVEQFKCQCQLVPLVSYVYSKLNAFRRFNLYVTVGITQIFNNLLFSNNKIYKAVFNWIFFFKFICINENSLSPLLGH